MCKKYRECVMYLPVYSYALPVRTLNKCNAIKCSHENIKTNIFIRVDKGKSNNEFERERKGRISTLFK